MGRMAANGIAAAGGDHRAHLRHVDAVLPAPPSTDRTLPPAKAGTSLR
jgi:hypothetical protein